MHGTRRSGLRKSVLHATRAPPNLLHQVARNKDQKHLPSPTSSYLRRASRGQHSPTLPSYQLSRLTGWNSGPAQDPPYPRGAA